MATITISENTGSTYSGTIDVGIVQTAPTSNRFNSGSNNQHAATSWSSGDRKHVLLGFTGLTNVSTGGTVSNSKIRVKVNDLPSGTRTIYAYRLLVPFVETEATWNIRSTGNNWGTAGANGAGDKSATLSASVVVTTTGVYFELTGAQLDVDVEDMINNPSTNYGWCIQNSNDTSYDGSEVAFYAKWRTDGDRPELVFDYATGGGSQGLTPSLFTNTNTFYSSTVTRGAVALLPSLVTNSNSFYSHTLTNVYRLTPSLFTNNQSFYSATVGRGAVSLTPSLFTNSNSFYSATVGNGAIVLQPSLFTNSNTIYNATVTYRNTLLPALVTNTNVFYSATVNSLYALSPALYTNSQTFYGASVSVGAIQLTPSLFNNTNQFFSPNVQIAGGVQYVSPNLIVNSQTFFNASLTTTVTLSAALVNNVNVFYSAMVNSSIAISPQLFVNNQVFFSHTVKFNQSLTAGLLINSNSFYAAFIGLGNRTQYPLAGINQDYPLAGFKQTYPLEG